MAKLTEDDSPHKTEDDSTAETTRSLDSSISTEEAFSKIRFDPNPQIKRIRSRREMEKVGELEAIWYTPSDYEKMNARCKHIARTIGDDDFDIDPYQDVYKGHCLRGLEKKLPLQREFMTLERVDSIYVVLKEQAASMQAGEVLNHVQIAKAYAGKVAREAERAQNRGSMDAVAASECWAKDPEYYLEPSVKVDLASNHSSPRKSRRLCLTPLRWRKHKKKGSSTTGDDASMGSSVRSWGSPLYSSLVRNKH